MRSLATLGFLALGFSTALAGQNDEAQITAVIERLFDGMRAGDSAMARSAFTDDAQLVRARADGVSADGIDGIIRAIGTPRDSVWDEILWDTTVHIDGPLASVWTKFAFFIGSGFSHCGVDSFQLHKGPDGWKIFWLADTQQREGCEMPPGRGH